MMLRMAGAAAMLLLWTTNFGAQAQSGCGDFKQALAKSVAKFGDLLPQPAFRRDPAMPILEKASVPSIYASLRCEGGKFLSYETALEAADAPSLVRWMLWSQATLGVLMDEAVPKELFGKIRLMQQAAIREGKRELIRNGSDFGCARVRGKKYEVRYTVQPGDISMTVSPADDEMESCKLLR